MSTPPAPIPTPTLTTFVGDCIEIPMPDQSVDLVVCSPPYEAARTYGIDFNLAGHRWVAWAVARYMECLRVSRGLVVWVVEGQTRQYRWSCAPIHLMAALDHRGVCVRKPPVYRRNGIPGSGGPDWLRNDYEFCVCATAEPGRLLWSDNTACGHPPKCPPGGQPSHRKRNGDRVNADGPIVDIETRKRVGSHRAHRQAGRVYKAPKLANPGNVIDCGAAGGNNMGSKLAHENEAPFPERLAEFFIRSFCPEGGTVLDCFSGSGTTAAVAMRLGRSAVAMDVRESQIDLTKRRVAEAIGGASC